MRLSRLVLSSWLLVMLAVVPGCTMFNRMVQNAVGSGAQQQRANPPVVTAGSPQLVRAPSMQSLAAFMEKRPARFGQS